MNVKNDLKIDKYAEDYFKKLNLLVDVIDDDLPLRGNPMNQSAMQKMTIANPPRHGATAQLSKSA